MADARKELVTLVKSSIGLRAKRLVRSFCQRGLIYLKTTHLHGWLERSIDFLRRSIN